MVRSEMFSLLCLYADESDVLPEISPFSGSVLFVIEEGVANAAVGFSNASLQATVIDGVCT